MYCPRCQKTISDDRLEEISETLRTRMDNRLLEQGRCPVCGNELMPSEGTRQGQMKESR